METIAIVALFAAVFCNSISLYVQYKHNRAGIEVITSYIGDYGMFAINAFSMALQFWIFSSLLGWNEFLIAMSGIGAVWQVWMDRKVYPAIKAEQDALVRATCSFNRDLFSNIGSNA